MTDLSITFVTAPSVDEAEKLALMLVERRVAACVQIVPGMTSHYVWEGRSCRSTEWLLLIKSTSRHWADIESVVKNVHSYETPEIVHLLADGALPAYLEWVIASVGDRSKG